MKLNIVNDEKNFLELKFEGDAHTFFNIIKKKLINEKDVSFVGYNTPHPLVNESVFVLRTKKNNPKKLINSAIELIIKDLKDLSL